MADKMAESSEFLCTAHDQNRRLFKLKLKATFFCLDDQQLLCIMCRDSEEHSGHKFLPVDKAPGRCKQNIQESLGPLKEKLKVFHEVKNRYGKTENHIKVQARQTETQIKKQFENLRRFLQEEEVDRIAALRAEEAQKSQEMKERIEGLSREMETLSDAIQDAEAQLRVDDHVSFLRSYKTTMEGVQLTLQDPPPLSGGALIDQAKHLKNLTLRVWDKMKDIVSYTPLILDPNTAGPFLMLSDDLTSVRCVQEAQQLPGNPERFDFWPQVLGSEGFDSGHHSWDVEVGDNTICTVGVCEESQQRDDPECRYWFIDVFKGECTAISSSGPGNNGETSEYDGEETVLSLDQKPQRIRVHLDREEGQLSFSDPDSDTHLHTFTHTFTQRLFPYVGIYDDDMSLKVLPGKICVTLENHS